MKSSNITYMSEKVHLIERPRHCSASAPASWRLVWGDQNHLVVSFGNTVQSYVVKEAPPSTGGAKTAPGLGKIGSMMTQSTMGMGSLVKQTAEHSVELAHQFRLDRQWSCQRYFAKLFKIFGDGPCKCSLFVKNL